MGAEMNSHLLISKHQMNIWSPIVKSNSKNEFYFVVFTIESNNNNRQTVWDQKHHALYLHRVRSLFCVKKETLDKPDVKFLGL